MPQRIVAAVAACTLLLAAHSGLVSAHSNLLHCSIKNNEVFTVRNAPKIVKAFFAEDLDSSRSKTWMAVFEGEADHGLVNEKSHSVVNFRNPKEMTLKLPKLRPEKYYLIWYTHSAVDGHYAAGVVYFRVKK